MAIPELRFIYSTMNSGKSLNLLTKNYSYLEQKKKTVLFTSDKDTRNGEISADTILGIIETRVGLKANAYLIERVNSFELVKRERPNIVLVDEAQFMSELIIKELCRVVDELRIPVTCYGIVTDFQLKFFIGSDILLRLADTKKELAVDCHFCTNKAVANMRMQNGQSVFTGEQIQVGGNESYLSVCRACYMEEKEKTELKQIIV